jgi:malonyl-CoA O-methyltransferase
MIASNNPPLVFLHGWGSDSSLWQPLCRLLPGQHYFVDLPGFGNFDSELPDLDTFLTQVAERLPHNCYLVGWSLGGMLAAQLARRSDRGRGLVTISSNAVFVARPDWPEAMEPATFAQFLADFANTPVETWTRFCALQTLGDTKRKVVASLLRQQSAPTSVNHAASLQGLRWLEQLDNRQILAELSIPQLHLFGAGDALVPAETASRLRDLLPASAEAEVLSDRGHAPHLSDPETIAAKLKDFFSSRLDKRRIARSFGDAAVTYDHYAHIQRRVAADLREFCPHFAKGSPVLDLGCGTGYMAEGLLQSDEKPNLLLADLAPPMVKIAREKLPALSGLVADAEALPLADESLAGVVSSLALQWCHDLSVVAQEAYRVLQAGGELAFSTLGPDTLQELKKAWQCIDAYTHVNSFHSPEAVRAALENAGFTAIEQQRYPLVAQYDQLMPLLRELKGIGAHNMNSGSRPGLTGIRQLHQLEERYQRFRDRDNKLPATYDVILVRAKKL